MENENLEEKTAVVIATAKLTQQQSELLLVKALLSENSELSDAVDGKEVQVIARWETSKWSDPNALVNIFFVEGSKDQQESDDADADEESESDDVWDDEDDEESGSEAEGGDDD